MANKTGKRKNAGIKGVLIFGFIATLLAVLIFSITYTPEHENPRGMQFGIRANDNPAGIFGPAR